MTIKAVLFDLDGTLADTARDLLEAMNLTLTAYQRSTLTYEDFCRSVAYGTDAMIQEAFLLNPSDSRFSVIKEQFLEHYQQCLGKYTILFDGIAAVLDQLDVKTIPWGIVTTKLSRFTLPLLKSLQLYQRTQCIVAGDTLPYTKPCPEPLLYGCQLLKSEAIDTLYVGDYKVDAEAAKAAGMKSIIIKNHYHRTDENPHDWRADVVLENATQLLSLF